MAIGDRNNLLCVVASLLTLPEAVCLNTHQEHWSDDDSINKYADGDEDSVPGLLMAGRLETKEEIGSTGFAEGVSFFFSG